ncbi:MAG: DNA polymerase III subunit beta [Leptonema sp. (in: bacteria)]
MEFIANTGELAKVLSVVTSIASSREIGIYTGNILLEAEEGLLSLTTVDQEKALRNKLPSTILKKGSVLLPARKLSELVKEFRYDTIKFIVDENYKVMIQNGNEELEKKFKTNIEIMGKSPEEFPIPFDVNGLDFVSLNPKIITEMIEKVFYASAIDDARIVFNGIFIEYKEDLLHFVATDGRRLSIIKRRENNFLKSNSIILPSRSIKEILKLISNAENVEIAHNHKENQIFIRINHIYFSTQLIEGSFPDYNVVIPKDHPYKVELDRVDFINAIRQAMVFAPEPNKQVRLNFKNKLLMIESSTPELGKVEDGIECDYNHTNLVIAFNSNYLLDVLESLQCKTVLFSFKSSDAPVVIYDPEDNYFQSIVMPMKLQD